MFAEETKTDHDGVAENACDETEGLDCPNGKNDGEVVSEIVNEKVNDRDEGLDSACWADYESLASQVVEAEAA